MVLELSIFLEIIFIKKKKYNNFSLKKDNFNNREINNYLRGFNYNNNKGRNVFKDF
jgi:hypothetical protein